MYNHDELCAALRGSVQTIFFTKVDGTPRTMRATLANQYLPPQVLDEAKKARAARGKDAITVWDLDKGAWRSIRMDSIEEVQQVDAL